MFKNINIFCKIFTNIGEYVEAYSIKFGEYVKHIQSNLVNMSSIIAQYNSTKNTIN